MSNVASKVKQLIVKSCELQVTEDQIKLEDQPEKLGISSIAFITLMVAIESEFGFRFDQKNLEINSNVTVGDIVNLVEEKIINS